MTDLGTLGGPNSCTYSINDRGKIAGVAQDEDDEWHAVVWYEGAATDLGVIGPNGLYTIHPEYFIPRLFGSSSMEYQKNYLINGFGSVAGTLNYVPDNLLAWYGVLLQERRDHRPRNVRRALVGLERQLRHRVEQPGPRGGLFELPEWQCPLDPPYGGFRAFSWMSGTPLLQLSPLKGYQFSEAWAVNDLGLAAGVSYSVLSSASSSLDHVADPSSVYSTFVGSPGRATVWWASSILNLGTLGGDFSKAVGVNSRNDVIGMSTTKVAGETHAFLKSVSLLSLFGNLKGTFFIKPMQDLGTLGGLRSYPNDLNYSRQVVGFSSALIVGPTAGLSIEHAFLWEGGHMTDLTPKAGKSEATAINAGGQVVGYLYPHVLE